MSIAAELDEDLTPELMDATDKVLVQLWMFGFRVTSIEDADAS